MDKRQGYNNIVSVHIRNVEMTVIIIIIIYFRHPCKDNMNPGFSGSKCTVHNAEVSILLK